MELTQVKRMAAAVLGKGINRIKIVKPTQAAQAMTKDDVRALIKSGSIIVRRMKGMSRVRARKTAAQKKKSRQRGRGSRKGSYGARVKRKETWMIKVRSLRRQLNELKPKLQPKSYQTLYSMIKGGYFRSKGHLKLYVKEHKLLQG